MPKEKKAMLIVATEKVKQAHVLLSEIRAFFTSLVGFITCTFGVAISGHAALVEKINTDHCFIIDLFFKLFGG